MNEAVCAGAVYTVPNLLGAVEPCAVLPQRTLEVARSLRRWVVETPKAARAFLASLELPVEISALAMTPIAELTGAAQLESVLAPVRRGESLGLLSDAGCPGVADPGAALVASAHAAGLRVVPLVGPSAIVLALMAAGLEGQRFAFHGYLPVPAAERIAALRALEARSRAGVETQVFIETPYRNAAMIAALGTALSAETIVCVAADLTLPSEEIVRGGAASWRRADPRRFERRPAIFLLLAARFPRRLRSRAQVRGAAPACRRQRSM